MNNTAYQQQLLEKVEALYSALTDKKKILTVPMYKSLLNDFYLKYFGFDRRAGKMITNAYITNTYCTQDPIPLDKCLLLACFLLEDVKLLEQPEARKKLFKKVLFIDQLFSSHFPDIVFAPLKTAITQLKEKLMM